MNKFQYKLMKFMMGRRGPDRFFRGLHLGASILLIADLLIPGRLLTNIATFFMIYAWFRMLSKNLSKRQAEENWYMAKIEAPLTSYLNRDKNYHYFKCPNCKQLLRAPKGRGKIRVTCSRCKNVFEKKV